MAEWRVQFWREPPEDWAQDDAAITLILEGADANDALTRARRIIAPRDLAFTAEQVTKLHS